MIKSNAFLLVALLSMSVFSQNESFEISRFDYTPVASNIIETYISSDKGSYYRLSFCEDAEIKRMKLIQSNSYELNKIEYTESFVDQKLLGGMYIVALECFPEEPFKITNSFKYISSIINRDTNNIYVKVNNYDEDDVIGRFKGSVPFTYMNYDISFSTTLSTVIHPYYDELSNDSYALKVDKYTKFFGKVGISCAGFAYCTNKNNNNKFLVALIRFGVKGMSYAMYGIWETDEANKYGFKKGQRIYMSEGIRLQERTFAQRYKISFSADAAYKRTADLGELYYTFDYIIAHRNETYPNLAWRSIPINSRSPKKLDENGSVIPDSNGYVPPNYPDNKNNTNPPGLNDCPDMDWYWSLFCDCAEKKYGNEDETKVTSTMYQSYNDYMEISMMENRYDPTIYGSDRSVSPLKVDTNYEPVQPYLYTKDCDLINKDFPTFYDPFDSSTGFYLQYNEWSWSFDNMGYITKDRDVKQDVLPQFDKVMSLFTDYLGSGNLVDNLKRFESSYVYNGEYASSKWEKMRKDVGLGFSYEIKDGFTDSTNLYIADKNDKNSKYKDARNFLVHDENFYLTGRPFKVTSLLCGMLNEGFFDFNNDQNPKKAWFLLFQWPIMYSDKYGIKREVGRIKYGLQFKVEENELFASGQTWNNSKRNLFLILKGDQIDANQFAKYDSLSKDYYADQYDVGDRDSDIENSEAITDIILKIAVSEGLDLVMKGLNYLGKKNSYFIPVYEGAKRLENSFTQSKTYKIAKEVYKGYVFYKRCMDVAADLRDEYNSISEAWDGLMYGVEDTWKYYKTMDWNKLRLSNCTMLLPSSKLDRLDAALSSLQRSISNTSLALYGCAFQADRLTRGNYGPFNPVVKAMTNELTTSIQLINGQTTNVIDRNTKELDNLTQKSSKGVSDQAYLSNIVASANCLITSQRMKLQNEKVRNLGVALYLIESESRDWITYNNYWKNIGDNAKKSFVDAKNKNSLIPIAMLLRTDNLFNDSRINTLQQMSTK